MRRFRGLKYFLAPSWLTGLGDGERIAHVVEIFLDAFTERARLGLEARLPSRAEDSAIELIRGDRGLLRGRAETPGEIAPRLRAWRTPRTHRVRGNAYETLLQIWHYWAGIYASTIDSHGLRHEINATDTPDVDTLANPDTVAAWTQVSSVLETNWDSVDADVNWSRFWVVLQPTVAMGIGPSPDLGDPALWGGDIGVPGYLLGQVGATSEDVSAMRALFQELKWGPGHARPEWLLLCLDPTIADPYPKPTGGWQYWSSYDYLGAGEGTRIAAREHPVIFVTDGGMATREGAGTVSVTYPSGIEAGDLLFFHEGRSDATSSTPGASWTLVKDQLGFFAHCALYAKIADGTESGSFTWTCTGSGNHVGKVTRVRPPPHGWLPSVLDNFSEIASTAGTDSSAPDPDNTANTHRLHFVGADFFDVNISADSADYSTVYMNQGNFNLALFKSSGAVTGSETSFSEPALTWLSISLVLSRAANPWRFWSLDPQRNNTYGGERTRPWAMHATKVDHSGVYTGSRASANCWDPFILPSGLKATAGVRRFEFRVLLLDDGSVIR